MDGRIFLTGGTGSLGQALLSKAHFEGRPSRITIFSRDEAKQAEVRGRFPAFDYVLGDVRDEDWMAMSMRDHDIVIHAAAYKQVPSAEVNALEAIETNVIGSCNVARAAIRAGVPRVIGISTDKACAPINCYGQSKALMEKVFAQACLIGGGHTVFNCVRYGNVLGSTGSIVPLFQRQRRNGHITITDPAMTRFWLTLEQAVSLVEMALRLPIPGSVLVPKAKASTMAVLAEAAAPEAEVKVIGTRPGEKMHEQLINSGEAQHTDDGPSIFVIWPAYTGHPGNLPAGYEYRSDTAPQLSATALREMIGEGGDGQ